MSVITVIKKIGEKIISIVSWPIKHSVMLAEFLADARKDYPATKDALIGLVQRIEALGPDALAALAAKGFDVPDDLKTLADLKGLFTYVQGTVLPTIEADYADFKTAESAVTPATPEPAPGTVLVSPAAVPVADAPGLHNVVPA